MSDNLDSTVDIARNGELVDDLGRTAAIQQSLPKSHVAIRTGSDATDFSRRFEESTRDLLRDRLIAASVTLCGMICFVFVVVSIFGQPTTREMMLRLVSLIATFGVFVSLYKTVKPSLGYLRMFEIVLLGIPMVEACMAQVFESQRLIVQGQLSEIPTLFVVISMAVAVFIAVYGMLVPARWYRTAMITGCMALTPTIVALIQATVNPELSELVPNFASTALLIMMAIVATLGSRIVHITRRQVESARQYGQYQLTEEIGRGGMGVVYQAEHRLLKRPAAIKLIRTESAFDETAIDRFESEVQLSAALSHWNTVQIYDYGRTATGDFYYVMEYLEGQSLQRRIAEDGALSVDDTVTMVRQLCDGLAEAHALNMVHRDLKPANIFLARTGGLVDVVKILDFGLAVESAKTEEKQSICGSPPYMSPEQILGKPLDHRSDIYAIGCIVFECLTGDRIFNGLTIPETFRLQLHEPPNLSKLSSEAIRLRPFIEKCLAKDADQRFDNVSELLFELDAVVEPNRV